MRDSLTVFAILLIVVLTAALVGPYFIDWNYHRGLIEAKLSQAAGARVAIAGPIEVKLLPQPTFRVGQVTLGETGPGQQSLTAARLDAQISLTALMRGDIQVVDATLVQPRLDLTAAANGTLGVPLPTIGDLHRVQFQHFSIQDGTVTIADPERGPMTLSGLDLDGDATTLLGPFKLKGQFGAGPARQGFRLSTGAYENGKLRLKLGIEGARDRPAVDLDGTVAPAGVAPAASAPGKTNARPSGPQFDGTLALSGSVPLASTTASIPWRLTTKLQADRDAASFADLELRAGTDLRGLVATGSGDASLGEQPSVRLRLHGSQVNFDTLAVAPETSTLPPPKGIDLIARLVRLAQAPAATPLPSRLDIDYTLDSATAGPQSIFGIAGRLQLDGAAPTGLRFAASGPDGARLALDGRFEGGLAPVFRGRLDAGLRDLPRFAAWLAPALPGVADWARRMIPAHAVSFAGTVDLSPVGGAARDATLTLDRTALKGTLSFTQAVGSDRARLFADLGADVLDVDDVPDLGGSGMDWSDLDLDIAFAASAVKIASATIGAAGTGPLDAGRLALRLHKTGPEAHLDRFSADFGTARFMATGSLDGAGAQAQVAVDAPDLSPVADLLAHIVPGRATALLQARAEALSPTRVDLNLTALRAPDGSLLPSVLSVKGQANGTDIAADVKPDRPGDVDPATASVSARLLATSPQSLTLLRQLGVPLAPAPAGPGAPADPAQIDGEAHGSFAAGFETRVEASLSGSTLSYRGKAKPDLGTGHLSLKGSDLGPLLASAGLLAQAGSAPWPVQGEADLSWHDSNVALRRLGGRLAGVAFSGDLNTNLAPPPAAQSPRPALFGTLSLDRLDLPSVFGLALGVAPPPRSADPPPGLWSNQVFGAAALRLPRTEIAVKAGRLALQRQIEARTASFILRSDGGALTLADMTGSLNGGTMGASLTLRHDGALASIAGTVSLSTIAVDLPGLVARVGGSVDIAGSGASPAALVASLAGTGSVIVSGAELASLDPSAIPRTAHAADRNTSEIDADQIGAALLAELDHGPLPVGDVAGPATLAAGVLRLGPLHTEGDGWTADTETSVDLQRLDALCRTLLQERQPLPDWKGEPAQIAVVLKGLPGAPERSVDAIGFINALQSRAIARDQERIDIIQQDIRERAAFNRRLKAIEADQRAARDRTKADSDARTTTELERLLDQDKVKPFEMQVPRQPGGPANPAPRSPARPPAPAGRSGPAPGPAAPLPRARPSPTRQAPQDPSVEGRY